MRIPHTINQNTIKVYTPSPEALKLVTESSRILRSEELEEWDQGLCPTLVDFAIKTISKNFATKPLLKQLPCANKDHLLELIATDLDLELVIPLIEDEYYWERRYKDNFGIYIFNRPLNCPWKTLFIERHVQYLVETAEPQYYDEEDMGPILRLCAPYVKRLFVTQLQAWKPPLTWEKDEIPDVYPIDHINFNPILSNLPEIVELDIVFGMNEVSDKFDWHMFKLSKNDAIKLAKAIVNLKQLQIFRLHCCQISDEHIIHLSAGILKLQNLTVLILTNCQIGDEGAMKIGKILFVHRTLQELDVSNNRIESRGATAIGYAIQEEAISLQKISIKLNPLGAEGCLAIIAAIYRTEKIKHLSIAGCGFEDDTCLKFAAMLGLNTTLKYVDVSNNWFDEDNGEKLLDSVKANRTIHWLDVRETDISKEQHAMIKKYLRRNRADAEDIEQENVEELERAISETSPSKTATVPDNAVNE